MQSIKEKPLTLPEVRELMQKRQKESELSYDQQNTLDYAQQFAYIPEKKAKELSKGLNALGYLSVEQVALLVNMLPQKTQEIKTILAVSPEAESVTDEQVKELTTLIKKFKPPLKK